MNNFVVSARKYRPATFQMVVGQSHITSTLVNAIGREQLAHAYLFCGPRGVGKTTCARIFAKAINCLSNGESETCGECESCIAFDEGRSFNIHELDAASNNSVDDIRSLTDKVRIPPQIGRYSVYIIDEVHMLSASAFNAFLKTLEEPPAHAIFILATTEKHKILPTILSRCQIFDFNRIRVEDGVTYLKYIAEKESITADDESLHLIAQKADGGMRDALSMFDKAVSFCGTTLTFKKVAQTLNILDYDTYFEITDSIIDGDYHSTLLQFDSVLKNGFSGQLFLSGLGSHFRDMLMSKNEQTAKLLEVTANLKTKYVTYGAKCDAGFMFQAIALLTSIDSTLRTATNQRLNIELGLMKLCGLSKKKSELNSATTPQLPALNKSEEKKTLIAPKALIPPPPVTIPKEVVSKEVVLKEVEKLVLPEVTAAEIIEKKPEETIVATIPSVSNESKKSTAVTPKAKILSQSISGNSIFSILSNNNETSDNDKSKENIAIEIVDPETQDKISRFRERFISTLKEDSPRLAVIFSEMEVKGNNVKIYVPSQMMYDEIIRRKTETLLQLSSITGVKGIIELDIEIREDVSANRKPMTIDEKMKSLATSNPDFIYMRKVLDLIE